MTTTELIELLQRYEHGSSGRSREITIYGKNGKPVMFEKDFLKFSMSGDGIAGAELCLDIKKT